MICQSIKSLSFWTVCFSLGNMDHNKLRAIWLQVVKLIINDKNIFSFRVFYTWLS